jgi:hypothetical protein
VTNNEVWILKFIHYMDRIINKYVCLYVTGQSVLPSKIQKIYCENETYFVTKNSLIINPTEVIHVSIKYLCRMRTYLRILFCSLERLTEEFILEMFL